jgi:4a-hydroxytetrahydrobiopterin dehydratase
MDTRLSDNEIAEQLRALPAWERRGDALCRTVACRSFAAAIALVVQVGFLAEAASHHPDIDIRWRRVTLALTTHDAGGLTARDFELAQRIDALVEP